jgi:hypothetical protein
MGVGEGIAVIVAVGIAVGTGEVLPVEQDASAATNPAAINQRTPFLISIFPPCRRSLV